MAGLSTPYRRAPTAASGTREAPPGPEAPTPPVTVGILHNPLSGGNRRGTDRRIRKLAARFGAPLEIARDPAGIRTGLARLVGRGVPVVALSGGDGTVQAAVTALRGDPENQPEPPLLAILPSGTTAMTAADMGLGGSPSRALDRLLRWAAGGGSRAEVRERTLLRVQAHPGVDPAFGFFLGGAAVANGVRHFHRLRHRFPGVRPGLMLVRGFLELPFGGTSIAGPTPMGLRAEGDREPQADYLVFFATTLRRLIFGMKPFWGSEAGPIRYTAVEARPRHLVRTLPRLVRGRAGTGLLPENGFHSHNTDRLELFLQAPLVLDGETLQSDPDRGPVTVEADGTIRCLVV